ncbi:hypothetical protein FKM82_020703, partial [Ascaphus truei]
GKSACYTGVSHSRAGKVCVLHGCVTLPRRESLRVTRVGGTCPLLSAETGSAGHGAETGAGAGTAAVGAGASTRTTAAAGSAAERKPAPAAETGDGKSQRYRAEHGARRPESGMS